MSERDESEDDWFERALKEDEASDDDSDRESRDQRTSDADADGVEQDAESVEGGDEERTSAPDTDERTSAPDADGRTSTANADEELFESDFATAFEDAPGPGIDGGSADPGFGGAATDRSPGSRQSPGTENDPFGFGFDDQGAGSERFDEENFESDIERLDIGIEGLDEMILGGVPKRSLIATIGGAGTGKTTFALQFLYDALERDRSGVFISLEESRERILNTADEKGWDFTGYEERDRLAIVDLDPIEMANSLNSIQNELPVLIEDFGAERLVLDSVSLLEMMYDKPSTRRTEVFEFTQALKDIGVTTLVTSEASEDSPYVSRYGIIEYLADAVFVLQYIRPTDFRETRLAVEIQKIRDANHSRETKPYEITDDGISVYQRANIF